MGANKEYLKGLEDASPDDKKLAEELEQAEKERIQKREDREAYQKARERAVRYFGSEAELERITGLRREVLRKIGSEEDLDFLQSKNLDNSPRMLEILANLNDHPEFHSHIKRVGLRNLIKLGQVMLQRRIQSMDRARELEAERKKEDSRA